MKSGRRRVLSLGMGLALAVWAPLSALAAWENPFRDVGAGDWFYGAVEYVNTAGLFDGTGAEAFSPNEPMTRGMFVKVLGCAAGAEPGGESASRFEDVPGDAYYAPLCVLGRGDGGGEGHQRHHLLPGGAHHPGGHGCYAVPVRGSLRV